MFNKIIASVLPYFPEKFVWIFSKSYVSGETMEDAMRVSEKLNSQNIMVTLDILGEFIKNLDEAEANKKEYLHLIDVTTSRKINGNFSLKPTSFGLLIDKEICYRHVREIVAKAASCNTMLTPWQARWQVCGSTMSPSMKVCRFQASSPTRRRTSSRLD